MKMEPQSTRKRPSRRLILGVAASVLVLITAGWWWHSRHFEETDDAQVDGHIYPISARVSGHLTGVYAEEGQHVKRGDPLAQIDSQDYQVAAAHAKADYEDALAEARAAGFLVPVARVGSTSGMRGAEAQLTRAKAGLTVALKGVDQARASLDEMRATAATANSDVERYRLLLGKREISQQQFDQATAAAEASNAKVAGAEAGVRSAEEQVSQAKAHVSESAANLENARVAPQNVSAVSARATSAQAKVTRAQAALERAQLDLSYTRIVAPVDGIVGRRAAQVGQNVEAGQDLMAIVPLNDVWITANYKEDQLARMRPGQPVAIGVDAYDREWNGTVTSIGGATGARYSLLPPENATGNYVKVVQRIPVRIDLTGEANKGGLLRPGMSAVPRVRVR